MLGVIDLIEQRVPWAGPRSDLRPGDPIIGVKDIGQAIKVSNGTGYGISSGACTDPLDYITRLVGE